VPRPLLLDRCTYIYNNIYNNVSRETRRVKTPANRDRHPSLPPADWQGREAGLVRRRAREEETLYCRWLPPKTRTRPPHPPPPRAATARDRVRVQQAATGRATVTVSLFTNLCATIRYSSLGENVKVFADLRDRVSFPEIEKQREGEGGRDRC